MNKQLISQGRRDRLLETAADWVARIQDGELPAETIDAWREWLDASPDHRRAFEDVQALWQKMGDVPTLPVPPERDALRLDRYAGDERVRTWLSNMPRRRDVKHNAWAVAASVMLVVGVSLGGWLWSETHPAAQEVNYRTVTGQHLVVRLPDDSSLELGAASEVRVMYSKSERSIELLHGIAFFDVKENPERPFVVRAGGGSVTAVGTAFSVQRRADEVMVVVSDGLVEVERPSVAARGTVSDPQRQPDRVQLPAGQRVAYSAGRGLNLPTVTDVVAETAWRDGQLVFKDEALAKVIDDVNRYSRIPIRLGDDKVGDLRLTGYIVTSQVDGWLRGLESVLPVAVERQAGEIVLLHRDESPGTSPAN